MIDKEDNFNEFLKQKVEESHFEYNEAYWLKAEQLLDKAQPKKKPFWWGFGLGAISLALVGGITALIFNSNGKPGNNFKQKLPVNLVSEAVAKTNESSTYSGNETKQISQVTAAATPTASVPLLASVTSSKNQKNAVRQHQNASKHHSATIAASNLLSGSVLGATENMELKDERNFSMVKNLSTNKLPLSNKGFEEDTEGEETIIIAPPVVIDARKNVGHNKDIDVNIVAACDNKNKHEWMFNVLAGVSDSRGFEGNTVSDSRIGFGYFGGFRLAYKLDKNWFIGAQPLMYSRGAVNTSIETEKTNYDFGSNADEFVVKNKALLFAEMPVSIGYRVMRHQISVGAGLEYLVNVKSDVKDFGTSNYTPNQWGYTDGFNRLGTIALFNYAFNIYNEFWLTMMVQKGFTDLTKSDYFTTNSKDKNFNLRIGVQYQFNNQKKIGK